MALAACTSLGISPKPKITKAVAYLKPTPGNTAYGTVTFIQEGNKVRVIAEIYDLSPGKHGIHIHEYGDCSSSDAMSAGLHFNPTNSVHGSPDSRDRHVGDLGNVDADKSGKARYERLDDRISLTGRNSIIGRSVVIKAKADDFKTQPGGGAGARIACGVIGISGIGSE